MPPPTLQARCPTHYPTFLLLFLAPVLLYLLHISQASRSRARCPIPLLVRRCCLELPSASENDLKSSVGSAWSVWDHFTSSWILAEHNKSLKHGAAQQVQARNSISQDKESRKAHSRPQLQVLLSEVQALSLHYFFGFDLGASTFPLLKETATNYLSHCQSPGFGIFN